MRLWSCWSRRWVSLDSWVECALASDALAQSWIDWPFCTVRSTRPIAQERANFTWMYSHVPIKLTWSSAQKIKFQLRRCLGSGENELARIAPYLTSSAICNHGFAFSSRHLITVRFAASSLSQDNIFRSFILSRPLTRNLWTRFQCSNECTMTVQFSLSISHMPRCAWPIVVSSGESLVCAGIRHRKIISFVCCFHCFDMFVSPLEHGATLHWSGFDGFVIRLIGSYCAQIISLAARFIVKTISICTLNLAIFRISSTRQPNELCFHQALHSSVMRMNGSDCSQNSSKIAWVILEKVKFFFSIFDAFSISIIQISYQPDPNLILTHLYYCVISLTDVDSSFMSRLGKVQLANFFTCGPMCSIMNNVNLSVRLCVVVN